jgi:hypothetical protein
VTVIPEIRATKGENFTSVIRFTLTPYQRVLGRNGRASDVASTSRSGILRSLSSGE